VAYLHDLLLVELALLGQVGQLAHVLPQHSSQAVIAHGRAGVFESISECGDDVCCVLGGVVRGHGKQSCLYNSEVASLDFDHIESTHRPGHRKQTQEQRQ